jgi:membrane protein implicated in regulation of membrane protease activity
MHIVAYTTAIIFAITSLVTQDVYYLVLGIIAAIVGINVSKD